MLFAYKVELINPTVGIVAALVVGAAPPPGNLLSSQFIDLFSCQSSDPPVLGASIADQSPVLVVIASQALVLLVLFELTEK